MPKQQHPVRVCAHCGQWDDHPRVVFADDRGDKHHDCLSTAEEAMVAAAEHGPAIIEAAKNGVHGDELRGHIEKLHAKKGGKS